MALSTIESFLELVRKSGIVEPPKLDSYLQKLRAAEGIPEDPGKLASYMVRDALLTQFQADQMLVGKWRGFQVGKYKVLEKLGSGGMGTVYLAEHKFMKRRVAIKVLPRNKANDPSALDRFYREAKAIAALDHPNIVRAYDIDQDNNVHFLVMEFVDGGNLQDMVKVGGPLPVTHAAHYISQAALGLQHANEMGLIHRDIKPGNLLVDRSGTVKVLDMGLARFFMDEEDIITKKYDENVLGTADYLSPEQALDSHNVDVRADIYGLGGTFYYMLTGRPPFGEGTVAQKLIWHQTRHPRPIREIRPEVPEELVAVIDKMMAKDPNQRYQQPIEVAEALKPWTQTPIPPPPEEHLPKLSPAARGGAAPAPAGSSAHLAAAPKSGPKSGTPGSGVPGSAVAGTGAPGSGVPGSAARAAPPPSSRKGAGAAPAVAPETVADRGGKPATPAPAAKKPLSAPTSPSPPTRSAAPRPEGPATRPASAPAAARPAAAAARPAAGPKPPSSRRIPQAAPPAGARVAASVNGAEPGPVPAGSGELPNWSAITEPTRPEERALADTVPSAAQSGVRQRPRPPAGLVAGLTRKQLLILGGIGGGLLLGVAAAVLVWAFGKKPTAVVSPEKPGGPAPVKTTTLYVSKGKVEPGDLDTITAALRKATAGDKIVIRDQEVYEEQLLISPANGLGKSGVSIEAEYDGKGRAAVLRAPAKLRADDPLLVLDRVDGFQIKGLQLDGQKRLDTLVRVTGVCPDLALEDLRLKGFNRVGVRLENCRGGQGREIKLRGLRIEPGRDGDQPAQAAIAFAPPTASLPGGVYSVIVQDCRIEGPYDTAVRFNVPVDGVTLKGNVFFGGHKAALAYPADGTPASLLKFDVLNNTFCDYQTGLTVAQLPRFDTTVTMTNNLFYRVAQVVALEGVAAEKLEQAVVGEGNVYDRAASKPGALGQLPAVKAAAEAFELPTAARDAPAFLRFPKSSPLATAGKDKAAVGALQALP